MSSRASAMSRDHVSRGTLARSGYRRTSSDCAAPSRRGVTACGHSQLSSAPSRRAASHRFARCGMRPRDNHRSTVLTSTP